MGATSMVRGGVTRFLPGFPRDSGCVEQPQSDVEFEFLDDGDMMFATSSSSDEFQSNELDLDLDEDDVERVGTVEENKTFWLNQHQILQTNLYRTGSLESRIRNATKEAVREIQQNVCSCSSTQITTRSTCRNCLLIQVSRRLQNAGYNSAICRTKWKTSPTIPSGEHTFVDVIDRGNNNRKQDVRVIIELNFRAEFEMAKGSEEYNGLVKKLPEVYVGKVERLSNIIKVMCMGAKRCMKENKMHMGPWRKHKYMEAKWLGPCKRDTSTNFLSMGDSDEIMMPKPKAKASLLTVDLLDKIPNMHCTAVEVL